MKFWQLVSMCRDLGVLHHFNNLPSNWAKYSSWYREYHIVVNNQDRSILDHVVPDGLCRELASMSNVKFYFSDGYLRRIEFNNDDEVMSAVKAYDKYGGEKLEEVLEFGSVEI